MTSDSNVPQTGATAVSMQTATLPQAAQAPDFDLKSSPIPSFHSLLEARADVFRRRRSVESFRAAVEALQGSGDEGRRKGLGQWMLGQFEAAAAQQLGVPCTENPTKSCQANLRSGRVLRASPTQGCPRSMLSPLARGSHPGLTKDDKGTGTLPIPERLRFGAAFRLDSIDRDLHLSG